MSSALEASVPGDDPSAVLDVVVELDGDLEDGPDAQAAKEAFTRAAKPVVEAISGLGGEVLGEAWINNTLRARVPASGIGELTGLNEVALVDVPHAIERE